MAKFKESRLKSFISNFSNQSYKEKKAIQHLKENFFKWCFDQSRRIKIS